MTRLEDTPKGISIQTAEDSNESIEQFIGDTVGSFVKEYVLVEFDAEKKLRHHMKAVKKNKNTEEQLTSNKTKSGVSSVTHTFVPGMQATNKTVLI